MIYSKSVGVKNALPHYASLDGNFHLYASPTGDCWRLNTALTPSQKSCQAYIDIDAGSVPLGSNSWQWCSSSGANWIRQSVIVEELKSYELEVFELWNRLFSRKSRSTQSIPTRQFFGSMLRHVNPSSLLGMIIEMVSASEKDLCAVAVRLQFTNRQSGGTGNVALNALKMLATQHQCSLSRIIPAAVSETMQEKSSQCETPIYLRLCQVTDKHTPAEFRLATADLAEVADVFKAQSVTLASIVGGVKGKATSLATAYIRKALPSLAAKHLKAVSHALALPGMTLSAVPLFANTQPMIEDIIRRLGHSVPNMKQACSRFDDCQSVISLLDASVRKATKKAALTGFRVAVIGPMKAGKSTIINTMVGLSLAPKRMEAMTQLATLITHVVDQTVAEMRFHPTPFSAACDIIGRIGSGDFGSANTISVNKTAVELIVNQMSRDVRDVYEQIIRAADFTTPEYGDVTVVLRGLVGAAEHNGKTAAVLEFHESNQRFTVQLLDASEKSIRVKPTNLQVVKAIAGLDVELVCGMGMAKHNGKCGTIVRGPDARTGEYMIKLHGGASLALQPINLTLAIPNFTAAKLEWVSQLKRAPSPMVITATDAATAEHDIREWLTRINDICRIASFFHDAAGFNQESGDPFGLFSVLEQMFDSQNIPQIRVEMELCKRFGVATFGEFNLIDTPGPDEAKQGKVLYQKVKQVLHDADAVICVVNGRQLKNQAQSTVQQLIHEIDTDRDSFDRENNIIVLINQMDQLPVDTEQRDREQTMKATTAFSFVGTESLAHHVFPTSGVQGLCHLQMIKLIAKIVEHLQGKEADRELYNHMLKLRRETADWIDDWVTQTFGLDGLPDQHLLIDNGYPDPDRCPPGQFLNKVRVKNQQRWDTSRLQDPMELVFKTWAGTVACEHLQDAISAILGNTLREGPLLKLRLQLADKYNIATSENTVIEAQIRQKKAELGTLRCQIDIQLDRLNSMTGVVDGDIATIVERSKQDLHVESPRSFIAQLKERTPDFVRRGCFDDTGTFYATSSAPAGLTQDTRIMFSDESSRDAANNRFVDVLYEEVDKYLKGQTRAVGKIMNVFLKSFSDDVNVSKTSLLSI
jgi:GTPase Era involved in 16S rRNA processing